MKGWIRQLTPEAEADRADFEAKYGDAGCTCFLSPPCEFCLHPGNPHNQEEDDECWEWISPGMLAKANRHERGVLHLIHNYAHTRNADRIQRAAKHPPRMGWGRKAWKWAKLELRGTYRRRDEWRLKASAKRVREAAESLARSVEAYTGKVCSADHILGDCGRPPAIVFSTPMTDECASQFKAAWEKAQKAAPPQPLVVMEPLRYVSMSCTIGEPPVIPTPGPNGELPPGWKGVPRYAEMRDAGGGTHREIVGVDIVRDLTEEDFR